ncbi:MAG: gliding motility-associated C-terminal domain-containing protein [Saprospiraceae bacterium]|nr:gliding motility-associated C-terminal domain-containing protein [Saprospiraceae bacterium]
MLLRHFLVFLFLTHCTYLFSQCPEITTTSTIPSCNPSCDLCLNDIFTINLTGVDLPNGGKIEYYANQTPGFNPYSGQGTLIGTSMITTPGGNCRICPELMGFMIDACGVEQNNEFIIMWTGSGFNTSNFFFDFAPGNNTGGGPNSDIGGGCGVSAGGGASIGGCSVTEVGAGFNLPANAVWVVFTSSAISTSYDFSAACGLGLKVYVSKSTCARSIGAFTNGGGTGSRTQGFSINGCGCGTSVTYDLQDPGMQGDGDSWAGGVSNNGCSAAITGAGNYVPAKSTITPFTYKIPSTWCDKTFEIVGIVNPKPDPMCCKEIFSERFSVSVKCPVANKSKLEVCDEGNGRGNFSLEDAESEILGTSGGSVEWFKDMAGTMRIMSPYNTTSTIVYARVRDGNCSSALVPIDLIVTPFTFARSTSEERCAEFDGLATFPLINLENFIRNGNNTVQVKFYEDIGKSILILPPYRTGTITIYASTCKGDCESTAVPIQLIVNPLPAAKNITKIECPDSNGKASFDLRILIPYIKDSVKNNTVIFYSDSTLKDSVNSSVGYRTDSSTLYVKVFDGKCANYSKVILKAGALKFDQLLTLKQCPGQVQPVFFDLTELVTLIQQGDNSIQVNFYADSTLTLPINSPHGINQTTRIFATYKKGNCVSSAFPIILEIVSKPTANSFTLKACSDSTQTISYILDSLKSKISGDNNLIVQFYSDSNLLNKINGTITTGRDTIYSTTSLGSCQSDPVTVIFDITPYPVYYNINDTTICNSFTLPIPTGKFISSSFGYFTSQFGSGTRLMPGEKITSTTKVYIYDSLHCPTQTSFDVRIIKEPFAGRDTIITVCEGTLIDLSDLVPGADKGGTYRESPALGKISGNFYNTNGLSGQTITLTYTVPAIFPCNSMSSIIIINIVKSLEAGLDTIINLCSIDSVDLHTLLRNADPGGQFFDIIDRPVGPRLIASNFGFGQYDFKYVVGDGVNCPKSTSIITVRFKRTTIVDPIQDIVVCKHYILPEITGINTFQRSSYYTQSSGGGIIYYAGDTIFNNIALYARGNDLNYCTNEVQFNIRITSNNVINISTMDHCPDYKFNFRGQVFDINRPNGSITGFASTLQECDTLYNIMLSFLAPSQSMLDTTLCVGGFVRINGKIYDASNPTGVEVLDNASYRFCDSTVFIRLTFTPSNSTSINPKICESDSIIVNGIIYNKNRPVGREVLTNSFGCDSIITIDLQFNAPTTGTFNTSICRNNSIVINGTTYNESKTQGIENLKNSLGCDSILTVNINILPDRNFALNRTLCSTEKFVLGGVVFDTSNSSLDTVLLGAASNGCDSIIDINLSFYPEITNNYNSTLCQNQFIVINNNRYDQNKPTGSEVLKGQGRNGCDSTININLKFNSIVTGNYSTSICLDDSIRIGKIHYSKSRLQGTDTVQSSSGCDSITFINVNLLNPSLYTLQNTLCPGESLTVNGVRYDKNNPSGIEVLKGKSTNSCDSILYIDLEFADLNISIPSEIIINFGESVQISVIPDFIPASVNWSPSTGLSCIDCLNPFASPSEDTEYIITLIDENGCIIVRRVKLVVIKELNIFVPNIFSPNGDNINDFFEIISNIQDLKVIRYQIYDRWGALLYSQDNTNLPNLKPWNGEFNGQVLNPGVYTYAITVESKDGLQKNLSGDITLFR